MPCRNCAERVVVKVNEHETLTYTCDECSDQGVARKGTPVYNAWLGKITRAAAPAASPEKKPEDKDPAAKKKPGVFDEIL